jgi:hypothetical protein
MKVVPVVVACLAVLVASTGSIRADERTPEQIKAAKEFAVEGIGFTATPQTIRAKWPQTERVAEDSNPKIGLEVLLVPETQNTDGIQFTFLDGKLMQIFVLYLPARVKKMGGWTTIAEKVVARLGKADADSKGVDRDPKSDKVADFDWVIPEAERWFQYKVNTDAAALIIWDREVARKKEAKEKAVAETGF